MRPVQHERELVEPGSVPAIRSRSPRGRHMGAKESLRSMSPISNVNGRYALRWLWSWGVIISLAAACKVAATRPAPASARSRLQVTRNPCAHVDWEHDARLQTQLHDHVRINPAFVQRVDAAGYDAISLMHYSGVASEASWQERRWPPEAYLSADFMAGLEHIKLFFPNAEEVGFDHLLSPFLTTYIAKWEQGHYSRREPWHYASTQQAIDLIANAGGLPFIAHPWRRPKKYSRFHGMAGMEIYNAYCRHKFEVHARGNDCNAALLRSWDRVLRKHPDVVGIAVNDWYGPWNDDAALSKRTRDSGKILVMVKAVTLADLRTSLASGAVLAIKDIGDPKGRLPRVNAIVVAARAIRIELEPSDTTSVHWIADGEPVGHARSVLTLDALPRRTRYVRAEIASPDGSTLYTQAFAVGVDDSSQSEP
jgi:hypothetical protein